MTPERIDAPHEREKSRLACVYSLQGDPIPKSRLGELARPDTYLELGRFRHHFVGEGDAAWPMQEAFRFANATLATQRGAFGSDAIGSAYVAFIPHSGRMLLLVFDFDADLTTAVAALQETCFRREELTVDGKLFLPELAGGLPQDLVKLLGPLSFGREVHQLFMVGTRLAAELPAEEKDGDRCYTPDGYMRLVYREDTPFRTGKAIMRLPAELNRPRGSLCAHGRGVTVLVGAAEHVEWGVTIGAIELVAALEQMRRIRTAGEEALAAAEGVDTTKPAEARDELGELTQQLGALEIDLSFGVAQYLDALRFPEVVLQSYRASLAETLGIPAGADRTAEMLGRRTVLDARGEELIAVESRQAAIRRRKWSWAAAYISLIAAPLTVILAFFGVNAKQVNSNDSLFARHYWPYYVGLLAIVLFGAALVMAAGRWREEQEVRRKASD